MPTFARVVTNSLSSAVGQLRCEITMLHARPGRDRTGRALDGTPRHGSAPRPLDPEQTGTTSSVTVVATLSAHTRHGKTQALCERKTERCSLKADQLDCMRCAGGRRVRERTHLDACMQCSHPATHPCPSNHARCVTRIQAIGPAAPPRLSFRRHLPDPICQIPFALERQRDDNRRSDVQLNAKPVGESHVSAWRDVQGAADFTSTTSATLHQCSWSFRYSIIELCY